MYLTVSIWKEEMIKRLVSTFPSDSRDTNQPYEHYFD